VVAVSFLVTDGARDGRADGPEPALQVPEGLEPDPARMGTPGPLEG
jgi:hypothetical protein